MGVLIEGENVVIRNATVEQRHPGGMQEYERRCPNGTFCTDGQICRVGFMATADAISYIDGLESLGFTRPTSEGSPEVALITQGSGFVMPCDWLELNQVDLGGEAPTAVAWVRGTELSQLVAPPGWKPGSIQPISLQRLKDEYDVIEVRDGVETYRHRETGEMRYLGRPKLKPGKRWWHL